MQRQHLIEILNDLLHPELFKDYAPNGLQVEGKSEISRIVTAVSATQNVLDQALALKADALLVHHGWFWRGENPAVVATKYRRLKTLMSGEINLIAYHLPLDAHITLGNNAQMAQLLAATDVAQGGENSFIWSGLVPPITVQAPGARFSFRKKFEPFTFGVGRSNQDRFSIGLVLWCGGRLL